MDYTCSSEILNNSLKDIKVEILFDKDNFKTKQDSKLKIGYYNDRVGQKVIYDSINLKSTFIIPQNGKSEIDHNGGGRGVTPKYYMIKEIVVNNKIYNRNAFDTLFKKIKEGEYQFRVE